MDRQVGAGERRMILNIHWGVLWGAHSTCVCTCVCSLSWFYFSGKESGAQ